MMCGIPWASDCLGATQSRLTAICDASRRTAGTRRLPRATRSSTDSPFRAKGRGRRRDAGPPVSQILRARRESPMWCRRAVVLLAFSLIVGDTADRQAVASAARSAIEAPKPAIDLESVVDRAFDRFAEAGPNAFAVEVARFDHSGAFAKQIAGLESQWKADVPSDALARAERIRSERV